MIIKKVGGKAKKNYENNKNGKNTQEINIENYLMEEKINNS